MIESKIHPRYKSEDIRGELKQIAAFFPREEPISIQILQFTLFDSESQPEILLQYKFPNSWFLAHIELERRADQLFVIGTQIVATKESYFNMLSLKNRTPFHYLFLFIALLLLFFVLFTFVLCVRTKTLQKKWLWSIFILFGFIVEFKLYWTKILAFSINLILFQSFCVGFQRENLTKIFGEGFRASNLDPLSSVWYISICIPVGAILFLIKRKKLVSITKNSVD